MAATTLKEIKELTEQSLESMKQHLAGVTMPGVMLGEQWAVVIDEEDVGLHLTPDGNGYSLSAADGLTVFNKAGAQALSNRWNDSVRMTGRGVNVRVEHHASVYRTRIATAERMITKYERMLAA